ncbi:three-Cys-motif partner protein TcmP [Sphaerisporangium dianthi]|uniref:Three-Cys-motif partner protein TcmP n=1 Tax=Sphaerisporangium dianthi TaxID=1436120 RepID=A0ABV9CQ36_9ACTN
MDKMLSLCEEDMQEVVRLGQPQPLLWRSEPRTLLKHHLYRQYLYCWMGKICQTFDRAAIVDAFAGPGEYKDGVAGSSIVIAKAYLEHSAHPRFKELALLCLEKRQDRRDHLVEQIDKIPRPAKFKPVVFPPGEAVDSFAELDAFAHHGDPARPTLWILDPFDISSVPFDLVKLCLARPRDEVLITWFADEIFRFCTDTSKHRALDRHFGHAEWRHALQVNGELRRKEALQRAYLTGLESLPGVKAKAFSISSKNASARYSLVFATHSIKGLECFNAARWQMDPMLGKSASEKIPIEQEGLFATADVSGLRVWLETLAGKAQQFEQLLEKTISLGFKETHLRATLDEMATEGLAVRERPLDYSRSPWPPGSIIRFYAPALDISADVST